jgi:hypothetical protein
LPISASPELYAALGRGPSGFDEIRGTPESDWLEFKQAPYHLDDRKQKLELAKDVSAFANARSGVIAIGIKTRRPASANVEVADELTPVRDDLLDCRRIRDVIRQYVYPLIADLGCQTWPMEGGKSVLTIEIPRQDSADRPFVVSEGISSEGEHHGNMFGYFKRDADAAQPVPPGVVHDLMRDGYRFREWPTSGSQTRGARKTPATREADEAQLEERRRSRAQEDAEAAEVVDEPHLIVQAWRPAGFQIKDIQGRFRSDFLQPPSVRQNGFNMDFGREPEVLGRGGLRKIRSGAMSLSVLPEGLVTLVVGSYILGWAMERSRDQELINSIPLVELIYEFCRFTATYLHDNSEGSDLCLQAQLQRLDASGARRLTAGAPGSGPFLGLGEPSAAAGGATEVVTDVVVGVDPSQAAFKLLADIYRNFGLGERAIPFTNSEDRSVDIEELAAS